MRPGCPTPIRFRAIVISRNRPGPRKQMEWLANGPAADPAHVFYGSMEKAVLAIGFRHECAGPYRKTSQFRFVVVHFRFFLDLYIWLVQAVDFLN
jgi:hypothetical protein